MTNCTSSGVEDINNPHDAAEGRQGSDAASLFEMTGRRGRLAPSGRATAHEAH